MAATSPQAARRRARLENLRLHVPLIPFDAAVAEHYADIFAECLRTGKMIPQNDMAVAATARQLGYSVLVSKKDEGHFRSIRGLQVITLAPS
jgi:predicted nucleic acid-binding protein